MTVGADSRLRTEEFLDPAILMGVILSDNPVSQAQRCHGRWLRVVCRKTEDVPKAIMAAAKAAQTEAAASSTGQRTGP
jgi:hypothetical protein